MEASPLSLDCFTDGASRGNPGPSAYAFIFRRNGRILVEEADFLGTGTNNTAEYQAVLHALHAARTYGQGEVRLFSDSELVIRQINGEYAVRKPHLASLCREVREVAGTFRNLSFSAVPREHPCIRRADELCNRVLDEHAGERRGCG